MKDTEIKVKFEDGQVLKVIAKKGDPGEKGDPGKDARPEDVAKILKSDKSFVESTKGKDGRSISIDEVLSNLKDDRNFIDSIKGKDGSPDSPVQILDKIKTLDDGVIDRRLISDIPTQDDVLEYVLKSIKDPKGNKFIEAKDIRNLPQPSPYLHGAGAGVFTQLRDVPNSYVGNALQSIRVNSSATGLEFYTPVTTDEKVKVSSNDTTAGYLFDKIVLTNTTLTKILNNPFGNEGVEMSINLASPNIWTGKQTMTEGFEIVGPTSSFGTATATIQYSGGEYYAYGYNQEYYIYPVYASGFNTYFGQPIYASVTDDNSYQNYYIGVSWTDLGASYYKVFKQDSYHGYTFYNYSYDVYATSFQDNYTPWTNDSQPSTAAFNNTNKYSGLANVFYNDFFSIRSLGGTDIFVVDTNYPGININASYTSLTGFMTVSGGYYGSFYGQYYGSVISQSYGGTGTSATQPANQIIVQNSAGNAYTSYGFFKIDGANNRLFIGNTTSISPQSTFHIYNSNESTTLTNFTQAITNAGILIDTDYTANAYTPGVYWRTQNDNGTRPKAGIFLQETATGTRMFFGTSNAYITGITTTGITINETGGVGINLGNAVLPGTVGLDVKAASSADILYARNTSNTIVMDWGTDGSGHARVRIKNSSSTNIWSLEANSATNSYYNGADFIFGGTSPSAKVHIIKTTEQLRVGYDISNYYSTTVSSAGAVTFNAVGASGSFVFSDPVTVSNLTAGSVIFAGASGLLTQDNTSFFFDSTNRYLRLKSKDSLNNFTAVVFGDITGNARGEYSIDIQTYRTAVTQVAATGYNTVVGNRNTVTSSASTNNSIFGYLNVARADNCVIVGGSNDVQGSSSSIFGRSNTIANGSLGTPIRVMLVGEDNYTNGGSNTMIGVGNTNDDYDNINAITIGEGNSNRYSNTVMLGINMTNTLDNSIEIGVSNTDKIRYASSGLELISTTNGLIKASGTGTSSFAGNLVVGGTTAVSRLTLATGTLTLATSDFSANTTLTSTSSYLQNYTGTGGHTLTLPSASVGAIVFVVKNVGTGSVTVSRAGSDTLFTSSSVTTVTLAVGESMTFHARSSSQWSVY